MLPKIDKVLSRLEAKKKRIRGTGEATVAEKKNTNRS